MTAPARPGGSLDLVVRFRARVERCTTPACDHVHALFPAPRHLLAERCAAADWWRGCVAHFAGACSCPGCAPEPAPGPTSGCACPPGEPAGLL